jgi:hypothetical protein
MTDDDLTGSMDYSDVMNRTEFGIVFGGACGFAAGPGELAVDARFDLGLTKAFSGGTVAGELGGSGITNTVYAGNCRNISFAMLFGYAF